jgi:hypothetical protein
MVARYPPAADPPLGPVQSEVVLKQVATILPHSSFGDPGVDLSSRNAPRSP